jgi:hypothetical protein
MGNQTPKNMNTSGNGYELKVDLGNRNQEWEGLV